jgi:hypothetical protein
MPFCANTIAVSPRSKGGRPATSALSPLAFSVEITTSCGPSAAGSSDALTRAENSAPATRSVKPFARVASRCGPRITQETSCPESASRTAKWLPTAPAPKMQIRMGEGSCWWGWAADEEFQFLQGCPAAQLVTAVCAADGPGVCPT